jgi:hypothetical protein
MLGFDLSRRKEGRSSLQQIERDTAQDRGKHERGDPVVPAKKRVTEQQHDSEHEHLYRKKAEHRGRDGEHGPSADVARDLRELDARQLNLLSRQLCSVFSDLAEELTHSAIDLRRPR